MSHRKDDIDEQAPETGDLLLVDLLYGELSDDAREQAAQTLKEDALEPDLAALSDLRALFRQLPQEEPPAAITAKLLHAAALHAPSAESGAPDQKPGILGRLSNLFKPVLMYPGLAAAASLVLIVLVGGTMYMAGNANTDEPELIPAAPSSRTPTSESRSTTDNPVTLPDETLAGDTASPETPDSAARGDRSAEEEAEPAAGIFAEELSAPSGTTRSRGPKKKKASQATKRSASSSSSSSRTARVYEGDAIAPNRYQSDSRGAGNAAGRASTTSQSKAPAADAVPEKAEAPTDDDFSLSATDENTVQQQRAAPPPKPSAVPSRKQEKKTKKKSADKSTGEFDLQSRIRSLHSEARTAASRGDCKTVIEAGTMINNLDQSYYRNTFRTDRVLSVCLSSKTSQE